MSAPHDPTAAAGIPVLQGGEDVNKSQTFRRNVPVKNQCSAAYFYGQDPEFEHVIQTVEGEYGSVLFKIFEAKELSRIDF